MDEYHVGVQLRGERADLKAKLEQPAKGWVDSGKRIKNIRLIADSKNQKSLVCHLVFIFADEKAYKDALADRWWADNIPNYVRYELKIPVYGVADGFQNPAGYTSVFEVAAQAGPSS